jgi:hypothetical protein
MESCLPNLPSVDGMVMPIQELDSNGSAIRCPYPEY